MGGGSAAPGPGRSSLVPPPPPGDREHRHSSPVTETRLFRRRETVEPWTQWLDSSRGYKVLTSASEECENSCPPRRLRKQGGAGCKVLKEYGRKEGGRERGGRREGRREGGSSIYCMKLDLRTMPSKTKGLTSFSVWACAGGRWPRAVRCSEGAAPWGSRQGDPKETEEPAAPAPHVLPESRRQRVQKPWPRVWGVSTPVSRASVGTTLDTVRCVLRTQWWLSFWGAGLMAAYLPK